MWNWYCVPEEPTIYADLGNNRMNLNTSLLEVLAGGLPVCGEDFRARGALHEMEKA
jgi:hypothetical protein